MRSVLSVLLVGTDVRQVRQREGQLLKNDPATDNGVRDVAASDGQDLGVLNDVLAVRSLRLPRARRGPRVAATNTKPGRLLAAASLPRTGGRSRERGSVSQNRDGSPQIQTFPVGNAPRDAMIAALSEQANDPPADQSLAAMDDKSTYPLSYNPEFRSCIAVIGAEKLS